MTSSHETSRAAYELSLQGYSLEHIAERLHTSDDRILQMIAKYQLQHSQQQPHPGGMAYRAAPESCLKS